MDDKTEYRYAEFRELDNGNLLGTAIRYGDIATIRDWSETFAPGSIQAEDVIANVQHDRNRLIARTGGGGLDLRHSDDGLDVELAFLPTREAQDARELVKRAVLRGLSVEFRAIKDSWKGRHRTILEAVVTGVALVTKPAYAQSTVASVRSEGGFQSASSPPICLSIGPTSGPTRRAPLGPTTACGKPVGRRLLWQ